MPKITWKKLEEDILVLSKKIPKKKYNKILCITKGGLILSYYLGRILGVNDIEVINVKSYEEQNQGVVEFLSDKKKIKYLQSWVDEKTLLVDDLLDSGKTLVGVLNQINNLMDIAVIYRKVTPYNSKFNIKYFGRIIDKGWIVFPYEK